MSTISTGERTIWKSGRYEGVPNHVYHSEIEALNMSTLKLMDTSPAHCRDLVLNPDMYGKYAPQKQKNFDTGSAIHTAVLEPDLFAETYKLHPVGNKNTLDYKAAAKELRAQGFVLLEQKQIDTAWRCSEKLHAHDCQARDIIRAATGTEVSYVVDGAHGLQYKIRVDLEVRGIGLCLDLKSTISADPYKFEKALTDLKYHYSKAFYMDRLSEYEPEVWDTHLFLAIEKEPPYEFGLFDVSPASTLLAMEEVDRMTAEYADCLESGEWAGYNRGVQSISVTGYEHKRVERAAERRENEAS